MQLDHQRLLELLRSVVRGQELDGVQQLIAVQHEAGHISRLIVSIGIVLVVRRHTLGGQHLGGLMVNQVDGDVLWESLVARVKAGLWTADLLSFGVQFDNQSVAHLLRGALRARNSRAFRIS